MQSQPEKKAQKTIKRGDWVVLKGCTCGLIGYVKRVAKDGSWVDVEWGEPTGKIRPEFVEKCKKKRISSNDLIIVTTIDLCPKH